MAVERVERASRVGDCVNLWAVLKEHLAESVSERFDVSECMAAFSTAVDENRVAVAAIFLDHGVKINTAHVRAATEKKHCEMLQLFLDHGWDINQPLGRLSPPALELMVEDEVMVHWFLNHGADPNAACEFDQTPLSSAVSRGSFSVIELLFNNGGDASRGELLQSVMRRTTPDQIDVITFLLERGAVVNKIMYQDYAGMYYEMAFAKLGTPLHTAAELGLTDVVALLVERDADPSIEDCRGLTAIDRAEQSGHPNVAEFLRGVPPSTSSSRNYFTRGRQLGLDLIY